MTATAAPEKPAVTSVEHCGEMHSTPFCPLCGAKLSAPNPTLELVMFLRKRVGTLRDRAAHPATERAGKPLEPESIEKAKARASAELAKFEKYLTTALSLAGMEPEPADATGADSSANGDEVDDI